MLKKGGEQKESNDFYIMMFYVTLNYIVTAILSNRLYWQRISTELNQNYTFTGRYLIISSQTNDSFLFIGFKVTPSNFYGNTKSI